MNRFMRVQSIFIITFLGMVLISPVQGQPPTIPIRNRPPHTLLDAQYSPDGSLLAQVYAEGRLEVTETTSSHSLIQDQVSLPYALSRAEVDWSPQGNLLAAGIGKNIYIWDVKTRSLAQVIDAGGNDTLVYNESGYYRPEGLNSLKWNDTGSLLMAQSLSSRVTVWSFEQQRFIVDQIYGNNPVPVVWLPNDRGITTGETYFDMQAQRWITPRVQRLPTLSGSCGAYGSISSSSDRTVIAQGTGNGCVFLLDAETGNQIAGYRISDTRDPIWDVAWSPDDRAILAVSNSGAAFVIEIATGRVALIAQTAGSLYAADWSPTNSALAFGGVSAANESIFETVNATRVEQLLAAAPRAELAVTPPAS